MVRDYELMYIVRPDVDDDGLRAAVDSVKSLVEGQGGEVGKTTMWGKRRLAYEVKHLRDGHYVIVEMRLDGSRVANVERALRIHDTVFRHLLVVQEAPSADVEGEEGAVASNGEAPSAAAAPGVEDDTETETPAAEAATEPETEAPAAEAETDTEAEAGDDIEAAAEDDEEE